jgi:dimethylglycine catabolism A
MRLSGDELLAGGMSAADCVEVARLFASSGLIDFLSVYQGTGDTLPDLATMLPDMTFPPAPFLYLASAVKAQVDIPVFHASGIRDLATANRAVAEGHIDVVAMTRAHIADPHIIRKLQEGRVDDIRQCVGANYCVDFAGQGGLCIQNPATGREATLPHILSPAEIRKQVTIVGGGPAGLEAARCALQRGHAVTLFETADELGGQINIARRVPKRENLAGIVRWLEQQVRRGGAEIRLGHAATAADVDAGKPDAVFLATGGYPRRPEMPGGELCVSVWDILAGKLTPAQNVLVYDEIGLQPGIGCVDFIAARGADVEMVTADRLVAEETGATLHVGYMRNLYANDVVMTPNFSLVAAYREGNRLVAVIRNAYTGAEEEREVDQIVYELGTLPVDDLYRQLRPRSRNLGEMDYEALLDGRPQSVISNPDGAFDLYRIGDALFSRNIHAAMYDAARLMKTL